MKIKKITRVEIKNGKRIERELTPEEVEQWKKDHGYNTENKTESDSE